MHSYTTLPLEVLFGQAVEDLPFSNKAATKITQGSLTEECRGTIEYSEEWTFPAGYLFDTTLTARGWVELKRYANADIIINAFFGITRNGDGQEGILKADEAFQGWYNPVTRSWELKIDRY